MSAQYSAFARPNLDASFFDREEPQTDAAPMFATPVYAQRTSTRSTGSGMNPAWIAVPVVVAAVGAGAYFMMGRHAEPTVASTKPPPVALAPVVTPQPEMAANTVTPVNPTPATASAATSGRVMTSQPAPVRVARRAPARTEAATAATGTGIDASATIPATPQPYSGSATSVVPAPVVTTPPSAAATAVQPVSPTPDTVTPEAATPPIAPQVPDSPTSPPTN